MTVHEFGNPEADIVLVQAVDEHDPALIESEIKATFEEFSEALKSGANDSIIEKKDHLITLLNERNAVMKTSK